MKKIILFGGSFDPIHDGHLALAKAALKQREADALYFIPAQVSPFKEKKVRFEDRYEMVKKAIAPFRKMHVSDFEGKSMEASYTIKTVEKFKRDFPNAQLEFLIGDDHIERLDEWKDIERLSKMIQFIVYERYGIKHPFPQIEGKIMDVSSTAIRQGKSMRSPKSVLKYMMEKGLYLEEMMQSHLSPKRYQHVLRVSELALEIASHHRLDLDKIYLAAMYHDRYREMEAALSRQLVPSSWRNHYSAAFDHAYLAADHLSRYYYVKDRDVLSAIRHHVDGRAQNPYAKVIYIADKCERGRNYDSEEFIELSKKSLQEGYEAVQLAQAKYLRRQYERK